MNNMLTRLTARFQKKTLGHVENIRTTNRMSTGAAAVKKDRNVFSIEHWCLTSKIDERQGFFYMKFAPQASGLRWQLHVASWLVVKICRLTLRFRSQVSKVIHTTASASSLNGKGERVLGIKLPYYRRLAWEDCRHFTTPNRFSCSKIWQQRHCHVDEMLFIYISLSPRANWTCVYVSSGGISILCNFFLSSPERVPSRNIQPATCYFKVNWEHDVIFGRDVLK